jgi:hypothetical protein
MSLYYPGYSEARENVAKMSEPELLRLLDDLFGRDNMPDGATLEEIRAEAFRQLREEWMDRSSPEYEQTQFWIKIMQAGGQQP